MGYSEIFRRRLEKYHKENAPDLYPEHLRPEIDELSAFINKRINAYACGFARSQEAFDEGYAGYFEALEELEERLGTKSFINGDYITLSDIHLYVALISCSIRHYCAMIISIIISIN